MLTLIGIIFLLMIIFGGHSPDPDFDEEEEDFEEMLIMGMIDED